jgi:hypothetical protein
MKKLFVCLAICLVLAGCQNGSGGNIVEEDVVEEDNGPDDRFVGKWKFIANDYSFFEFKDSSNFTLTNNYFGWIGIGTYTFTDNTLSLDVKFEIDDEEYSFSLTYRYYLTDNYLDILPFPDAPDPVDPLGITGRHIKQ